MEYIKTFLSIQQQIRLYHWTTKTYNQHVITGKLYEKLDEHIDKFIEILLANNTVDQCNVTTRTSLCTTREDLIKILKKFVIFLNEQVDLTSDLLTIRDEIIGEVHRHLYLLKMN